MAIQSFQLDPNAQSYTDDEIVGKINTATANITRASSVAAAARPIAALEVGTAELAALAVTGPKLGADAVDGTKLADAAVDSEHLTALSVGTAALAATAVTNAKLALTAAKDSLDAMADTARGYIKTNPAVGEFPVTGIQRDASGELDVEYDDVAIT